MTHQEAENEADLIHGVRAIGVFLGLTKRKAQHWLDTTDMPVIRTGRSVSARRSALRDWLAQREARGGAKSSEECLAARSNTGAR